MIRSIADPTVYVAVRGHRDALDVLRTSNRRWTYFSPAVEIVPGCRTGRFRTGRFRTGTDQQLVDATGRSHISMEDAAPTQADEVELPQFVQRRFVIGYEATSLASASGATARF